MKAVALKKPGQSPAGQTRLSPPDALSVLEAAEFADIDRHFSRFILRFGENENAGIAAALLSRAMRAGHICLDLAALVAPPDVKLPTAKAMRAALAESRAVGGPADTTPLVFDGAGRLYLRRYFEYERALAASILARGGGPVPASGDAQTLAIATALALRFVVISGGPGTGKTTAVLKILTQLVNAPGGETLRIALAAPTGKAAARLQESLRAGGEALAARLIAPASTLHRLLGARGGGLYFHHDAKNPLPADVVVVDEASMVPLTMMAKLFAALPSAARVILLGDRDQLASVEPGAVLGDIAEAASMPGSPIASSLVVLRKNFRFGDNSNIFKLSNAVREGDAEGTLAILRGTQEDVAAKASPPRERLAESLRERVVAGYAAYLRASEPTEAIRQFQNFRVLCAMRVGPFGVENVNRLIAQILADAGLIDGSERLFRGMPLLVTRNDYHLRLFNGDIGIVWPDAEGKLNACFIGDDGTLRRIPPARLPQHEPAFAMTVHKSQGSEFGEVLLLLPDQPSPVLTRELIYTGLTRARQRVEVWFEEAVLRAAILQKATRGSGLRDALSGV